MSSPEAFEILSRPPAPGLPQRPPAWDVLARALAERQPVRARYHGHERVLCPHALGWRGRRAKVLAYQAAGTTSTGELPAAAHLRWRSMFVEELEGPAIVEARREGTGNYSGAPIGMDVVEVALGPAQAMAGRRG